MAKSQTLDITDPDDVKAGLGEQIVLLLLACIIGLISNAVYQKLHVDPAKASGIVASLPGMAIFFVASVIGMVLARILPFKFPAVAWISLITIFLTIPGVPGSEWVVAQAAKVNFLSLATPALAYGGLALSAQEFKIARTSGWKLVVVAICVMLGTYLGSVIIADITLKWF